MKISIYEYFIIWVGIVLIIAHNTSVAKLPDMSFEPYDFDSDTSNLTFRLCQRVAFIIYPFSEEFINDITDIEVVADYAQQFNYTEISGIRIEPGISTGVIRGSFHGCKVTFPK